VETDSPLSNSPKKLTRVTKEGTARAIPKTKITLRIVNVTILFENIKSIELKTVRLRE
jgi:hypothetical protein